MKRRKASHNFTSLRIEGGILPPDFVKDIAGFKAAHQTGPDYDLSKSLVLKEEIARYWHIANDLYTRYHERRCRQDLKAKSVGINEWLVPFFRDILGYADLHPTNIITLGDRIFKITHLACDKAVPFLLTTNSFNLDKSDPCFGSEGLRQAPHALMQEYLNGEDLSLWGMVSNGSKIRILRDNTSLTRPSFIEADLDLIFSEALYADFSAFWLVAHASRLRPNDENPSNCIIESWRATAHQTGVRALENLRNGVTQALDHIGNGFLQHPHNDSLRSALDEGTLSSDRYFQQLLRLVYRLLFLLTTEERNLLHTPEATDFQKNVFVEGYSLTRLRERALQRRHYDHYSDLWKGLQITFICLAQGVPDLGLPALGGLFRSSECPHLDKATITNEKLLDAVRALSYFRTDNALSRVNYRDMGTEELGSVYESLLELQPVVEPNTNSWTFHFVGGSNGEKTRGSKRKLTGSYYTPPTLVNQLIRSTLEPVIAQATANHPDDPRTALLNINILDPACGSGHFLLAAARRMATEIARIDSDANTYDEFTRYQALREVVQHCIYGVDRNPLAVELCKTALWIETVEPGKPLTFLDSHIQNGDSLVGILDTSIMEDGIPKEAYKPLTGDDKDICSDLKKKNKTAGKTVQIGMFDTDSPTEEIKHTENIDNMSEDTLDDVEKKRIHWETELSSDTRLHKELFFNLFMGAYFRQKTDKTFETIPHNEDLNRWKKGELQRPGVEHTVRQLAERHKFLHWPVAFGNIMQQGGFDVVLGNPPWERIKLQEQEFFAARSPKIARAPNKAERERLIQQLADDDSAPHEKALFAAFQTEKREAEAISQFIRTGRRYPLTGKGDINTYAVFTETYLQLINPKGRAGLIVPTGIATDDTTKTFFDHIVTNQRLASLYDFENREKIFTGIDSRIKFCLLTLSGSERPSLNRCRICVLSFSGRTIESG